MFLDLTPLTKNKEFRKLFIGQTVSFLGSMMTYVAIPYQVYELTKSSFMVGLTSSIQLVPLLLSGLYGGALADKVDRRKLLIISELSLFVCALIFFFNSLFAEPSLILLYVAAALSSVFVGLHRPAMDALVPQIVEQKDFASVAALGSLRYAVGAIAGPALAGWLIAAVGVKVTYLLDASTFLIAIVSLSLMKSVPIPNALTKAGISEILDGLKFAKQNPVILGSYLVDIIAMMLAMPIALFPQIVDELHQREHLGWLYAAMPVGAGLISLLSKPLSKYSRHGAGVILSASMWGVAIIIMGLSRDIFVMCFALFLAGAFDSVSAIYRGTIWNEVIPANVRGRLGSLNMLSYMVGPLLGNLRAGSMAAATSTQTSILWGGVACTVACLACIKIFPTFWSYHSKIKSS